MKQVLFIFFLTSSLFSFAQTRELNVDHYENGNLYWRGYDTCFTFPDNGKPYKICYSIGFWEYWYEDGSNKMQTYNYADSTKYINMWTPNGKQTLKNGAGFYYNIEFSGDGNNDSLVYQITDSIKHGVFKRFRCYTNSTYFQVEWGQYENNKALGTWRFKDSIRKVADEWNYVDGKENGKYKSYYINGNIKEDGFQKDGQQDSIWKYYDENGKLTKECGFRHNRLFGKYAEYYSNGQVKVTGQYVQLKGYEKVYYENPNNPGELHKQKEHSERIPAMDGEWKYYNENGKLTKTKVCKKKRVKNNR